MNTEQTPNRQENGSEKSFRGHILWPVRFTFGMSRDATTVWRSSLFVVRLLALVMGSVAFAGVLSVTDSPGPGLQVASGYYLGAAESLVAGHGYRVATADWSSPDSTTALTRYPPGFPTAIALPERFGFPPDQAARLVEALSAFVAVAALVAIVGDAVGAGAAFLLGVALFAMPMMVEVHLSVLSEPLFLASLALTLALMVGAPDAPLAAGLCAALAFEVRYAGIAAVAAVALWHLVRGGSGSRRARRAALAVLPGVVIGGVWAWIVHRATSMGAPAPTDPLGAVAAASGAIQPLRGAGATLARWLVPTVDAAPWAPWLAEPLAAAVAAVAVIGTRRAYRLWALLPKNGLLSSSTNVPQMIAARVLAASALLGVSYGATLVAAQVFTDRAISLGDRMLAPLMLVFSVGLAVAAANWWRSAARPARAAAMLVLAVWGAASLRVTHRRVREALSTGFDFAHEAWQTSGLLEWVRNDGNRRVLYSNWPTVAYLYLDRPARGLPVAADGQTLRAFGDTLAARGGGGVILAFNAPNPSYVAPDSLVRALGLRVVATYPDGRVLGPPPR